MYIIDIAKVGFGYANRFRAISRTSEGEKVLGQVMMLKDANLNCKTSNGCIQIVNANAFDPNSEFITKGAFNLISE